MAFSNKLVQPCTLHQKLNIRTLADTPYFAQ